MNRDFFESPDASSRVILARFVARRAQTEAPHAVLRESESLRERKRPCLLLSSTSVPRERGGREEGLSEGGQVRARAR